MQLLLLHPPRNVYVACEHRCVRAHPPSVPCVVPIFLVKRSQERLTCSATRRARECSAHTPPAGGGTGWFGWTWTGHRCRPRALDHARTHQRPPCARGRGDRSNYQCPPRQRDVPANASVKHSHHTPPCLLAVLALECTSEFRLGRTQWLPAYSSDAVARRFLIWERMPAAVRSYGDTVTGAASHLPIADWFQVIVLPVWLVACKCASTFPSICISGVPIDHAPSRHGELWRSFLVSD